MLNTDETMLITVDMQEKIIPAMNNQNKLIKNTNILIQGCEVLGLKILFTEQYKKGLGETSKQIIIPTNSTNLEKISFSIFGDEKIKNFINQNKIKNLIIIGIEAHVCVMLSALDALKNNYNVFIISDAISSRTQENYINAINLMRDNKITITNTESILFAMMKDAKHPAFKTISNLIK